MQKKNIAEQSSNWQDGLKKQQRADFFKKIAIWAGIIAVCVTALGGLVMYADKSSSTNKAGVENPNLPKVSAKDIIVGDKNAKITITEYADFQCPACANFNPVVNKVLQDYKGKTKLVYRFFPLKQIHKNALVSSQAGYAANKLGKFPEMKDLLYGNQPDWEALNDPRQVFEGYASSIGLNADDFKKAMNSDEAKNAVLNGEKEAIGLGLNSTPTFFIGNKQFAPSGYDDFKSIIDTQLQSEKPLQ